MTESLSPIVLTRTSWEIRPRNGGRPIRGDLRVLAGAAPRAAIIICHGFKGFRHWGFFPSVARAAARRGYAAISFDFSHNGIGDDGVDFSAIESFALNTHSRNLDEIQAVVDVTLGGELLPRPPREVALLGHSRGGAEAIVAAVDDGRIDALVTWAAIGSIEDRWTPGQIDTWRRGGTVWIPNSRTGQDMPVGPGYWKDIVEHRERFALPSRAANVRVPWLIAHGEADETVPVADARDLFAAAGPNAELCLIEGAGHTFGATHPYAGPTPELRTVFQTTLSWLDEQLG